ncbi:TPA: DUF1850 domain-containing protein [Pasteurella multocida]|uniref:DUF1850 domain-containing protein n=1 Tax=Pasteurella multocida TaxID=747 RepID=UPI0009F64B52|nr:DUF1850 domain-containing protein [Pasteurella multocida]MEB3465218.1 DUF1850 domain-containing protein [Pasteurella multocida]PNM03366.1 DUF1850 domain-containing protein [Pasteurella multocida]HDR1039022.1 DUF1850 domain-containing protein [Pasteurella multocida]HDR1064414.1 DUF1850 domain-containing protein [Pasteurella multocida]HDR1113626.1 DUF1850 domain-containing protein [Pasteurella multocida]
MLSKRSKLMWGLAAFTLLAGLLPVNYLVVTTAQTRCYLRAPEFSLQWRHSVEHQLWQEHYRHDGKRLFLYQTWLQTFGAGTPSQGTSLVNVPLGYIGYEQHIELAELDWVVSRRMEGTINSANWHFPIYQTLPDYSTVNIKPTQSPLILFLLGSACNDG